MFVLGNNRNIYPKAPITLCQEGQLELSSSKRLNFMILFLFHPCWKVRAARCFSTFEVNARTLPAPRNPFFIASTVVRSECFYATSGRPNARAYLSSLGCILFSRVRPKSGWGAGHELSRA